MANEKPTVRELMDLVEIYKNFEEYCALSLAPPGHYQLALYAERAGYIFHYDATMTICFRAVDVSWSSMNEGVKVTAELLRDLKKERGYNNG